MSYTGYGATTTPPPPPPKKMPLRITPPDPALLAKYPAAQKAWCAEASRRGLYPSNRTCNEAIAAGAPMTNLDEVQAAPGSPAAFDRTKLFVGIGIAVVVIGIGAYLISK